MSEYWSAKGTRLAEPRPQLSLFAPVLSPSELNTGISEEPESWPALVALEFLPRRPFHRMSDAERMRFMHSAKIIPCVLCAAGILGPMISGADPHSLKPCRPSHATGPCHGGARTRHRTSGHH